MDKTQMKLNNMSEKFDRTLQEADRCFEQLFGNGRRSYCFDASESRLRPAIMAIEDSQSMIRGEIDRALAVDCEETISWRELITESFNDVHLGLIKMSLGEGNLARLDGAVVRLIAIATRLHAQVAFEREEEAEKRNENLKSLKKREAERLVARLRALGFEAELTSLEKNAESGSEQNR